MYNLIFLIYYRGEIMKDYLATTKVNSRLATSIPSAIRTKFEINEGDIIYWDIEDDKIIIKTKNMITHTAKIFSIFTVPFFKFSINARQIIRY